MQKNPVYFSFFFHFNVKSVKLVKARKADKDKAALTCHSLDF